MSSICACCSVHSGSHSCMHTWASSLSHRPCFVAYSIKTLGRIQAQAEAEALPLEKQKWSSHSGAQGSMINAPLYSGAQGSQEVLLARLRDTRLSRLPAWRRDRSEPHQKQREHFINGNPASLLCTIRRSQSVPHYFESHHQYILLIGRRRMFPDIFYTVTAKNGLTGEPLVCKGVQWSLQVNSWHRVGRIQSFLAIALSVKRPGTLYLSYNNTRTWCSTANISAALVFEENKAPEVTFKLLAQAPRSGTPQGQVLMHGTLTTSSSLA
jgi:hypothetical protein